MLSDRDRALLTFEDAHPVPNGRKEDEARTQFGLGHARYNQLIVGLSTNPEAIAEFPQLTARIRRRVATSTAKRAARVF